jgi:hypothetical protein
MTKKVVVGLSRLFHKFGDVFYPTPTPVSSTGQALTLPLNGREVSTFLPSQGPVCVLRTGRGGQEGDGSSVGVMRNVIVFMKSTTKDVDL